MTMPITIRDAAGADTDALAALKLATFRETFLDGFGIPYPPADLALFEAESYGAQTVARELADPAHRTWVAEAQGRMVGYAHVGPCKLLHPELTPGEPELYQIYLLNAVQGQGLGRRLLDTALGHCDLLAAQGGGRVWLGVWSGNARARAVYAQRGFAQVGEYHFRVGAWLDDECILRRG